MLFDHAVFQQPGINFGVNYGKGYITYPGYQDLCLCIYIQVLIKIGCYPVTQIFSLAYIDKFFIRIPKLVYARFMRDDL